MSKKQIAVITLVATICFLVLGLIFKSTAEKQKGVSASTGAIINGQFVETSTGRLGADQEKYEKFNAGGTAFYVLCGITGVICVITFISMKRERG